MIAARVRASLLLLAAIIMALGAGGLAADHLVQKEAALGEWVEIWVLNRPLPALTVIQQEHLRPFRIPRGALLPAYITDLTDAKGLVAALDLPEGTPLTTTVIRRPDGWGTGVRVLTLFAHPSVILEPNLRPGDRVDIYAAYEDGAGERQIETVAANVEVIAPVQQERNVGVTLAIPDQAVARLIWMENFGRQLRVLRRSVGVIRS